MPRPRSVTAADRITPYQSRVARQTALREAGGWIGTVELSAGAVRALGALRGGRSINATIEAALIDAGNDKSPQPARAGG